MSGIIGGGTEMILDILAKPDKVPFAFRVYLEARQDPDVDVGTETEIFEEIWRVWLECIHDPTTIEGQECRRVRQVCSIQLPRPFRPWIRLAEPDQPDQDRDEFDSAEPLDGNLVELFMAIAEGVLVQESRDKGSIEATTTLYNTFLIFYPLAVLGVPFSEIQLQRFELFPPVWN